VDDLSETTQASRAYRSRLAATPLCSRRGRHPTIGGSSAPSHPKVSVGEAQPLSLHPAGFPSPTAAEAP
jgi:hypothetical protein